MSGGVMFTWCSKQTTANSCARGNSTACTGPVCSLWRRICPDCVLYHASLAQHSAVRKLNHFSIRPSFDTAVRSTGECMWREVPPRGRHPDPHDFSYGHELSLLSAVRIKGCLNQENFKLRTKTRVEAVFLWESSAVTNILLMLQPNHTAEFFFNQSRRKFSQFHPKKGTMYTWSCLQKKYQNICIWGHSQNV